jgi:hypothetical protein
LRAVVRTVVRMADASARDASIIVIPPWSIVAPTMNP